MSDRRNVETTPQEERPLDELWQLLMEAKIEVFMHLPHCDGKGTDCLCQRLRRKIREDRASADAQYDEVLWLLALEHVKHVERNGEPQPGDRHWDYYQQVLRLLNQAGGDSSTG